MYDVWDLFRLLTTITFFGFSVNSLLLDKCSIALLLVNGSITELGRYQTSGV